MNRANKCSRNTRGSQFPGCLGLMGPQDRILLVQSETNKSIYGTVIVITINRYMGFEAAPLMPHVAKCYSSYTKIKFILKQQIL